MKTKASTPKKRVSRNRRSTFARRKPRPPQTSEQYFAKPEKFRRTYDRVIEALAKMRSEKSSLAKAAQEIGISPHTVVRWGGSALKKNKGGKYAAKPKDNLLRMVRIPASDGTREIAVRGSQQASLLGEYWSAVHRYLQTGDASQLATFQGKHVKDADGNELQLPTGRAELNHLASAGVLSFES